MNCLIVDNNQRGRSLLAGLVRQAKDLTLAGECSTPLEALMTILHQPIDLIFLNMDTSELPGLALNKKTKSKKTAIIFTTYSQGNALVSLKERAVDYIENPVTPARFVEALQRAKDTLVNKNDRVKLGDRRFIFVREANAIRRIQLDEILFIEAMGDYIKLYTLTGLHIIHTTMRMIENVLPADQFVRVHRSYIISISKIDSIESGFLQIRKKNIPVADTYRAVLNKKLQTL